MGLGGGDMSKELQERLAAMRREVERQNDEWARVKAELVRFGEIQFRVPAEVLEELEEGPAKGVGTVNINAVRG
jgi:hypothetical protein